jgi:hypothetical protein
LPIDGELPKSVEVVFGNQVYVDRSKLPPALINRLARLAAFQNPEFYAAQAMRLPTFGKPRIISCAELFSKHVALPRGCLDDVLALLGDFGIAVKLRDETPTIQQLYAGLIKDPVRNDLIFDDILTALEAGRSPVVITERKEHVAMLAERLSKFAKNVVVLRGGMSIRQARAAAQSLADISEGNERVLVATGRYLGEGFDDARLDTLFLTLPISWRGTLAQYAGRLHRLHAAKREVLIYDYVDAQEPMLAKMAARRNAGYRSLGYQTADRAEIGLSQGGKGTPG